MGALTVALLFLLARILFRRRAVARARRAVRAARRDVLRPEPDRDERRLHRRRSSSPRTCCSRGCGSSPAATLGVLAADAGRSACCSASRSRRSGSRPTRSARSGILILARSALGRLLLIVGHDRPHRRARLDGAGRARGQRRVGQPAVHADHDRAHARDGRGHRLPPDRVVGRGDAVRGRRRRPALGILVALVSIVARARPTTRSPSGRSLFTPLEVAFALRPASAVVAYVAFQVGRPARVRADGAAAGPGRARAPAAAARRRPPRAGCAWARASASRRLDGRLAARDPARRLRDLVHPVGAHRGPPAGRRAGRRATPARRCVELTGEMYRYHNNLTAPHAASSPWWAWPLNLKPVWFYQGSFAERDRGRRSTTPATWSSGGWASRRWPSSPTRRSSAGACRSR